MIDQLKRVVLFVEDLNKQARFYRDVLGLKAKKDMSAEGWIEFDCGSCTLALHGDAGPHDRSWGTKVVFSVTDIEATHQELTSKSVLVGEIQSWAGMQYFDATDPEGNDIQFATS